MRAIIERQGAGARLQDSKEASMSDGMKWLLGILSAIVLTYCGFTANTLWTLNTSVTELKGSVADLKTSVGDLKIAVGSTAVGSLGSLLNANTQRIDSFRADLLALI